MASRGLSDIALRKMLMVKKRNLYSKGVKSAYHNFEAVGNSALRKVFEASAIFSNSGAHQYAIL
jgi:hypothetical protein